MTDILMPKATAVWLIDNTALTFDQIAEFCRLHPLEVKGIADGDVAVGVRGADPIANGQLTREEIEAAEKDSGYHMKLRQPTHAEMMDRTQKGPRYTPLSRRQERPNAIAWLVKNHPEVTDAQISRLIGTTKTTIQAVRDRTHWNSNNIKPEDPVALGLCSQIDLDGVVRKAAEKHAKELAKQGVAEEGAALQPIASESAPDAETSGSAPESASESAPKAEPAAEDVFGSPPEPESAPETPSASPAEPASSEPESEPAASPDVEVDPDSVFAALGGLAVSKTDDAEKSEDDKSS